jgi:hypothetical protein
MSFPYITNPFAPSGLAVPPVAGIHEESAIYVFSFVLTANQIKTNLEVSIDTDSDFYLKGIVIASATSDFRFRYADESGYYTSNAMLDSSAIPVNAALPFPVTPQLRYSAGGRIPIDLTDTSGAGNTINMWFLGTKRFQKSR